jgi:hypothetical protein
VAMQRFGVGPAGVYIFGGNGCTVVCKVGENDGRVGDVLATSTTEPAVAEVSL